MLVKERKSRKKILGFTLLELLVVILILGLLAGIVIPRIVGRVDQAKYESTRIQLKALKSALEQFRMDNGFYPTTEQGLRALVEKPEIPPFPKRWHSYLDELPMDGWGNEFVYFSPGEKGRPYELFSVGPDGIEGTEDDISVWELVKRNQES